MYCHQIINIMNENNQTTDVHQLILKLQHVIRKVEYMRTNKFRFDANKYGDITPNEMVYCGIEQLNASKIYQGLYMFAKQDFNKSFECVRSLELFGYSSYVGDDINVIFPKISTTLQSTSGRDLINKIIIYNDEL